MSHSYDKVNLGCGDVFVDSESWLNLDYSTVHQSVVRADLLSPLPIFDGSVNLMYSSHLLEHFPKPAAIDLLSECFRCIKPGGVLRLVLPDFDELVQTYLLQRNQGNEREAAFAKVEILDQCVRRGPGGELGQILASLLDNGVEAGSFESFVKSRVGDFSPADRSGSARARFLGSALSRFRLGWITFLVSLLPSAFRQQNVSLAPIGELHHWIWDFVELRTTLESIGFSQVTRVSAVTSRFEGFPFRDLDLSGESTPRKGQSSMYIEGIKS